MATTDSFDANGVCKARFASSRRPEHDYIFSAADETTGTEIGLGEQFGELEGAEVVVFKSSRRIEVGGIESPGKGFNFPVRFNSRKGACNCLLLRSGKAQIIYCRS